MPGELDRRDFLKSTGAGLGVLAASGLFQDRLVAGALPAPGVKIFESRFGVSRQTMLKVLQTALAKGGDYADLYFEYRLANAVTMEDDIIKESSETITLGVGIRVLSGKQTGFAYTSDLTAEKMQQAAKTAAAIAASGKAVAVPRFKELRLKGQAYPLVAPVTEATLSDKIAMVKEAYAATLAQDPRIIKARVILTDELQYTTLVNSEGLIVSDVRPQARLVANATAEEKGNRSTGSGNAGGRVGTAFYRQAGSTPREIGENAGKEAVLLLAAVNPLPGDQMVVLGKKQSGVMIHEAVGHPLEADGAWRKTSIMWDRQGQMVANPLVTIYEDPTIPNYRGSLNVDDEGIPTSKTMLVEKGRLVDFLHNRLSARIMGVKPNGHGRRQSFDCVPIPRMNNTVLAPGESDPEEIIKSVKKGFFAESYFGGQVEDTGKFVFAVNLGFLIEDGKLTRPVKNATLIGTNVQILKEIDMVGNDLAFFLGSCGKEGQTVPVTAGTPTMRIRQMTVGGRA